MFFLFFLLLLKSFSIVVGCCWQSSMSAAWHCSGCAQFSLSELSQREHLHSVTGLTGETKGRHNIKVHRKKSRKDTNEVPQSRDDEHCFLVQRNKLLCIKLVVFIFIANET